MMRLAVPSWASTAFGLLAGIIVTLNQTTFGFAAPWHQVLEYGLIAVSAFGISPLIGPAFANALHVSHKLMTVIASVLVTVAGVVQTLSIGSDAKGIVLGIIAVIGALGFGSVGSTPAA